MGKRERRQPERFDSGSLPELIPEDHVPARRDKSLDLGWLRAGVADCSCADNRGPGIDPEVAVRLMLAGLLFGIVHDRRLMREVQVNLAIRWFIGYGLDEVLPDHSPLTRIRQRWGGERFRRIFQRTVRAGVATKIAMGEVVHIEAERSRRQSGKHKKVSHSALPPSGRPRSNSSVENRPRRPCGTLRSSLPTRPIRPRLQ